MYAAREEARGSGHWFIGSLRHWEFGIWNSAFGIRNYEIKNSSSFTITQ